MGPALAAHASRRIRRLGERRESESRGGGRGLSGLEKSPVVEKNGRTSGVFVKVVVGG